MGNIIQTTSDPQITDKNSLINEPGSDAEFAFLQGFVPSVPPHLSFILGTAAPSSVAFTI